MVDAKYLGKDGIFINNTDVFFRIENCTFYNADGTLSGIYLENVTHGEITNCTVENNYYGFYSYNSTNNTISNITASYNDQHGIIIKQSNNFTIFACILYENFLSGVYIKESDNCTIRNNTARENNAHGICLYGTTTRSCIDNKINNNTLVQNDAHGIYLTRSSNSTLFNNTIYNNSIDGIYLYRNCWYNNISFNIANFNDNYGIYLYLNSSFNDIYNNTANNVEISHGIFINNAHNNTIVNNTARNNKGISTSNGIYLFNADNNTLIHNLVKNNTFGIFTDDSINNEIQNNFVFESADNGIHLEDGSNNNSVFENMVENNGNQGIHFDEDCFYNIISNNTIINSTIGIYLDDLCKNNTFFNNTVQNCSQDGIFIKNSDNNTVIYCNISYNGGYGVVLFDSDNCIITNNILIENGLFPCIYENGTSIENVKNPNTCNPYGPNTNPIPSTNVSYSVFLDWSDVSWADFYYVFRNTSPIVSLKGLDYIGNVTISELLDNTIITSDTYYYAVMAVNNTLGVNSTISTFNPITNYLPIIPPGPQLPTSTSNSSIYLTWTQVSWVEYYLIYRNTSEITSLEVSLLYSLNSLTYLGNVTTNSFIDNLTASGTYYYAIIAVNDTMGVNSSILSFGPITVTLPSTTPAPDGFIGLIILIVVFCIIGGVCGSLFVLHKKEKIDLNEWKNKILKKTSESAEAKMPKKGVEKIEPEKKEGSIKPKPIEKEIKPKKEAVKPKEKKENNE